MAKDPAVLWYWNDWNGGTSTFTRHLKGCYIDLLSAQFNSGRLSLAEIKTVLGADFGPCWPTLQKKFRKDENEMYYNERMEEEKEKRRKFTEGRRKNLDSKKITHMHDHVSNDMGGHMENEIENGIPKGVVRGMGKEEERVNVSPNGFLAKDLDPDMELDDLEIGKTIEYIRLKHRKVYNFQEIRDHWKAFKIQNFSKTKWYKDFIDLINHFRDALKTELTNGKTKPGSNAATTSGSVESLLSGIDT